MPASNPNQRCTCGHRRFRSRRQATTTIVSRWMRFVGGDLGGFGSTPFGSFFGSEPEGNWGLFTGTLKASLTESVCESCSRARSSAIQGGVTPLGYYIENGYFYLVAADVRSSSCLDVRFDGPGGSFTVPLSLLVDAVPPPAPPFGSPQAVEETPPVGAVLADALLRARLPEVDYTGEYAVTLVDRCCGCETFLISITLEAVPMILSPLDADLGGAPRDWLFGHRGQTPAGQPASGSRLAIPFDKCAVVHEFDARFGSLPAAQGWTFAGVGTAGDWAPADGGAIRGVTAATSYWTRTTAVSANPGSAFSYARIMPVTAAYTVVGSGIEFQARYATVISSPYQGLRYNFANRRWYATALSAGTDLAVTPDGAVPEGWTSMGAADNTSNREQVWVGDASYTLGSTIFGTDGSAGSLQVISSFGGDVTSPLDVFVRNAVMSYGGRFIRAAFDAFAAVTNPTLRLYLVADANGSASKTARFLIRYGEITGNAYNLPLNVVEQTVNFTSANVVYEVPLSLPGLTQNKPFWFTIERAWSHGDDLLAATVSLLQASVRSS